MSNRSLFEINHDYAHQIAEDPERFMRALQQYLRAGAVEPQYGHLDDKHIYPGVRVFGMRHHSSPYSINWGGVKASEGQS